jgi:SSS family solute:Na+ symporter
MEKLAAAPDFNLSFLNFFPKMNRSALITFTFFVYIFMTWWHRAPGNGYYVQRLLATKSEKDSFFAFLWFNICQYVIRPWPWIIVGLLSLYYIPVMDDPESAFPMMINLFMPVGLKGIMVAAMLAAFMSTIDTHLNWGTSYLINDFYRPFISDNKSTRHYVFVARIGMILLTITALIITTKLYSVLGAYKYLGVIYGGIGTVMIARWYWWRVNPYSEISAIITSLIVANLLHLMLPSTSGADLFAVRVFITVILVTAVWVTVTFLTSKETPNKHTIAFYSKMRISGPGWKRVRKLAGVEPDAGEFTRSLVGWLSCVVFLFSVVLGIGKFLFHLWLPGSIYIGVAIVTGYILKKTIAKIRFL